MNRRQFLISCPAAAACAAVGVSPAPAAITTASTGGGGGLAINALIPPSQITREALALLQQFLPLHIENGGHDEL